MKKLIGILLFVLIALIIGVLSVPAVSITPSTEPTIYTTEEIPTTTAPIATTEVIIKITVETTVAPTESTTIPTEAPTEPTTVPTEPTEPIKDGAYMGIDPNEYGPNGMTNIEMLACVIYQEAGWDRSCDTCRFMVGDVVLNRVISDDFPNTIYEVLTEWAQYGNYCVTGIKWPDYAKDDFDGVERAWYIANSLLRGDHSEIYEQGYVWQSRKPQGKGGFWCHGTYFGYS
jgi:hypothetical protein